MLVAWRAVSRRALTSHISQLPPLENPSICSSLTALMARKRRATQLAARDEPKHKLEDVKPRTKGEHASRPLKRARIERQPEERAPPAVETEPKELERES